METFSALLALCEENLPVTLTKASEADLWSAPEQAVERTVKTPVIWDTIALIRTSLY